MNRSEFVSLMSELSDNSKVDSERALNLITDSILHVLKNGDSVNLVGFGSYSVQQRKAREGRNPKTGDKMHIAAYHQPSFKAGKKLKEACNSAKPATKNKK